MKLNKSDNLEYVNSKFTEKELATIKQLFKVYKEELNVFFKNSIEKNEENLKNYPLEHIHYLIFRVIIFMQKHGAKSIDEFDKLDKTFQTTISKGSIKEENQKIKNIQEEAKIQQNKEQIQTEIMSYFIKNPDENIMMGMTISKDPQDGCEVIDFGNAKYEDQNLEKLFSGSLGKRIGGLKLKANESGQVGEEFSKELAIDRKTDTKGMLVVGKKGFTIEQVDFEDISKYDTPYETYFAYKKNGETYIKKIKNDYVQIQYKTIDGQVTTQMNLLFEGLKELTPEMIQNFQAELIKTLKEAKNNGTLDEAIDMLISQIHIPNDMKDNIKSEFYSMAND